MVHGDFYIKCLSISYIRKVTSQSRELSFNLIVGHFRAVDEESVNFTSKIIKESPKQLRDLGKMTSSVIRLKFSLQR